MGYTPSFTPQYENGWEDLPLETTPITAEALNAYDDAIENVEEYLTKIGTEVKTDTTGQFSTITGGLMESCVVTIEPIQSGSGTPSPSNVRPITGHTAVEVGNVGKNKYNPQDLLNISGWSYSNGVYSGSASNFATYYNRNSGVSLITVKPNTVYTLTIKGYSNSASDGLGIGFYYTDGTRDDTSVLTSTESTKTVTSNPNKTISKIHGFYTGNATCYIEYIQIEESSQATPYEPYLGKTYTINLGGTYYGGTFDAVSGVLTVDRAYVEFDGSNDENWGSASGTGYHQYGISINEAKNSTTAITNRFSLIELSDRGNKTGLVSIENDTIFRFALKDSDLLISDVNAWKTWLSSNPLQVVYELATPTTIQLTPTQISTLIGENHLDISLEGQTLDSLSYREMMAWDDVEKAVENYVEANPSGSSTGTLTKIKVDGTIYDVSGGGGSDVSITPTLSTGTKIADFEIDGVEGELYAPTGGGGNANIWTGTQAELEEVFDELEEGTQINITDDEQEVVEGGTIYSEEEQVIGLWLDKRPVYQKTINFGTLPNATTKSVAHGISNITGDNVISINPIASTGGYAIFAKIHDQQASNQCFFEVNDTNVICYARGANLSSFTQCYVTIQYTKTTDAPLDAVVGKRTMYIASSDCYSTEEKEVGCYTDGKPLYQKTFEFNGTYTGTNNNLSVSLPSAETAFITNCWGINASGVSLNLPYAYPDNNTNNNTIFISSDHTYLGLRVGSNQTISKLVATIQYTKTTDTAGSGSYTPASGKAVHYSTDEQVIGTWVDGKPLYRRTITGLSIQLNGTTWVNYNPSISIDKLINVHAYYEPSGSLMTCAIAEYQYNSSVGIQLTAVQGYNRTVNTLTIEYTKATS